MARSGAVACHLIGLAAAVEGSAARSIGHGMAAVEALSTLLKVVDRVGVEVAEGDVPTTLTATTKATGAGSVEGCRAG